jgi:hypothetical protein
VADAFLAPMICVCGHEIGVRGREFRCRISSKPSRFLMGGMQKKNWELFGGGRIDAFS